MNIFEQYGIKEVADVCLYSIELDENDDEIYVPILYLDTLKVSTVEQTAEQTSARGGLGNPELIIWDYGKEITVTLEDALYSPASQSLMWSGKYGTKTLELKGTYQPYKYMTDTNGNPIYFLQVDENQQQTPMTFEEADEYNVLKTPIEQVVNGEREEGYITEGAYYAVLFDGLPQPAKVICDTFSNFSFGVGGGVDASINSYQWLVNMKMISDNNIYRAALQSSKSLIENSLMYKKETREWSFKEPTSHPKDQTENVVTQTSTNTIVFYKTAINENGDTFRFPIGCFTLDEKINRDVVPPQEVIYQIKEGIENVPYLERIEKCIAPQTFVINCENNLAHSNYRYLHKYDHSELTVFIDPKTMLPYEPNTTDWTRKNGQLITGPLRIIKQHEIYYKWTRRKALSHTSLGGRIIVDAVHFPGTYRLVGETYSRSRETGKDQRFQFEIPLCKMGSENNLTLEAAGDPTTFTMTLKVLRREDGVMMKLTQFDVTQDKYDNYVSDSTVPVPTKEIVPTDEEPTVDYKKTLIDSYTKQRDEISIISPMENTLYDYHDNITATGEKETYSKNDAATTYSILDEKHDIYVYQKILNGILTPDFLFESGKLKTEEVVTEISREDTVLQPDDSSYTLHMEPTSE